MIKLSKINLRIEVTDQDIREGCKSDSGNCPIANAGNRALREIGINDLWFSASPGFTALFDNGEYAAFVCVEVPIEARRFMNKFDGGDEVDPFEFYLNFIPAYRAKES